MNKGLSDTLKAAGARPRAGSRRVAFTDTKPVQKPLVTYQETKNPY